MMPPRAGEMTESAPLFASLAARHAQISDAKSACCKTRAHWKNSRLCNPELRTKCPCSRDPVRLNISRMDSSTVYDGLIAIASISTLAPLGKPETSMVDRAGGASGKNVEYTAFISANRERSVKKTVVFIMLA